MAEKRTRRTYSEEQKKQLVALLEHGKPRGEIIAGHNRVQASRIAGMDDIPCIIREMDDDNVLPII